MTRCPLHVGVALGSLLLVLALGGAGCKSRPTVAKEGPASPSAAASVAAPVAEMHAGSEEEVRAAVNPNGEKPYSGPIGRVRGVVHVSGDSAPELPEVLRTIPRGKCEDARAFYGKLFREGPGRELGDVLVGITGYSGYLPAVSPARTVLARGCAFESRTIGLVFGQRLDVRNLGGETFIPRLRGNSQAALVVAMPGGEPVKIFPNHVGQYELADQTHDFAKADVFVLKFPTFSVTGLDGKFDFSGIPAGEVTVSAYSPATRLTASQKVNVVAGETADIEFTLPFSRTAAPSVPSASSPSVPSAR